MQASRCRFFEYAVFGCTLLALGGCDQSDAGDGTSAGAVQGDGGPSTQNEFPPDGGDTRALDGGPTFADAGPTGRLDGGEPLSDAGPPAARTFLEQGGLVSVEAEHYQATDDNGTPRSWYTTAENAIPDVTPDPDAPHLEGASGNAYLEGLPDTRVTHDDPLIGGENFFNRPGTGPLLSYRIRFQTAGTYFVWGRAVTTGTEDNGIHVGIDGEWPSTGARIQWCGNRGNWAWSSAQRDSGGSACGVDGTITIEIPTPGDHVIEFSMREDGFEFDKFVMTTDPDYEPRDEGPPEQVVAR